MVGVFLGRPTREIHRAGLRRDSDGVQVAHAAQPGAHGFEREARVLASLNHPHIGTIYGFEEVLGVHGLVLELVERLIAERSEARKQKDFARSDAMRNRLLEMGVELRDGAGGTQWKVRS